MAKILVIEDDVDFRNVLKTMLERQNYDVTVASDGEEGMRLYSEISPDLVITDLVMPNRGGLPSTSLFEPPSPLSRCHTIDVTLSLFARYLLFEASTE